MRVEDPLAEVVDRALVVDLQPDEVRRVDVETEVGIRDRREQLVPDRRRPGEVVPAGPLVVGEDHRAVLDRDPHAALARVRDERRPDLAEALEVLGQRPVLVVADERPDRVDPQRLGGVDHLAQVPVDRLALGVVGMEVVRVVGEGGDLEPVTVERGVHLVGVESLDVDVRHPGVAALLAAARRPARDLEHLEAVRRRPFGDAVERQVGERRGHQSEPHRVTSIVVPASVTGAPPRSRRRCRSAPRRSGSRSARAARRPGPRSGAARRGAAIPSAPRAGARPRSSRPPP